MLYAKPRYELEEGWAAPSVGVIKAHRFMESLGFVAPDHLLLHENVAPIAFDEIGSYAVQKAARKLITVNNELPRHKRQVAGIAATQLGIALNMCVLNIREQQVVVVNPKSSEHEGEFNWSESCISLQGLGGNVGRARSIRARGYLLNGRRFNEVLTDHDAKTFLHKEDHLHGILFPKRLAEQHGTLLSLPNEELPLYSRYIRGEDVLDYAPAAFNLGQYNALLGRVITAQYSNFLIPGDLGYHH